MLEMELMPHEATVFVGRRVLHGYFMKLNGRLSDWLQNQNRNMELTNVTDEARTVDSVDIETELVILVNAEEVRAIVDEEDVQRDDRVVVERRQTRVMAAFGDGLLIHGLIHLYEDVHWAAALEQTPRGRLRPLTDATVELRGQVIRKHVAMLVNFGAADWFSEAPNEFVQAAPPVIASVAADIEDRLAA
jgi:hypothetical protein